MKYEWFYQWGRDNKNKFYHAVTFFKDGLEFSHWSYDGDFHEDDSRKLTSFILPKTKAVIHNKKEGIYHSFPGNPWYDHNVGSVVGCDWDWVGVLLDCGMSIMCCEKGKEDRLCDFTLGGVTKETEFIIENRHFYIYDLGAYLTLTPIKEEIIFHPKQGRPYSETPILVEAKGRRIGWAMRERTYRDLH
jgi:hypothetical protein